MTQPYLPAQVLQRQRSVIASGLAASAYLARRFGTKQVYVLSLVGFTAASIATALGPVHFVARDYPSHSGPLRCKDPPEGAVSVAGWLYDG